METLMARLCVRLFFLALVGGLSVAFARPLVSGMAGDFGSDIAAFIIYGVMFMASIPIVNRHLQATGKGPGKPN
jgi:hypothetical protein